MKRIYRGLPLWLPGLLSRTTLYLFTMSLILFALYGLGNFQHISDGNLRLLMKIMDVYFYAYLILSLGNILVHILFVRVKILRTILFYSRTGLHFILILLLYMALKLLGALFGGI